MSTSGILADVDRPEAYRSLIHRPSAHETRRKTLWRLLGLAVALILAAG